MYFELIDLELFNFKNRQKQIVIVNTHLVIVRATCMNNFEKFMIQLRTEFEERQKYKMSINAEINVQNQIKLQKKDQLEEGKRLREDDDEQITGKMQKRVKIEHIQSAIKEQMAQNIQQIKQKPIRSITGEQILSKSSVSQDIIQQQPNYYNLFKCLCGKQQSGSIHLFLHIKQEHMHQSLAEIMLQKIENKIMKNQHANLEELGIMEEMDLFDYSERLASIARNLSPEFKGPAFLSPPTNRGTYADMANIFISEIATRSHEKKVLVAFFGYLRKYIEIHIGKQDWQNQAPGNILRSSNSIIVLYEIICKKYNIRCPLSQDDIREILYILSKWMLDNRWTNDRVLKVNEGLDSTLPTCTKSQIGNSSNKDFDYLEQESFETIKKGMIQDSCRSQPELTYFYSSYTN